MLCVCCVCVLCVFVFLGKGNTLYKFFFTDTAFMISLASLSLVSKRFRIKVTNLRRSH